jgi:endo-1,4-beta-xylanase
MIYELNKEGMRSFGLAIAKDLSGPWIKRTDRYATGDQLKAFSKTQTWTEMVSHGELLRSGYNEKMEYEPNGCRWLIQGVLKKDSKVPYPSLPWKLGIISKVEEY